MIGVDAARPLATADLPEPGVPQALPDIPGGEPNLMPVSALNQPVRLTFTLWNISDPAPDAPESVIFYCNGIEVVRKRWEAPLAEDERYVEVRPEVFAEGTLTFDYQGLVYNGTELHSSPLTVTVDKTPPVLGGDRGRGQLLFPELGDDTLTEDFLARHQDLLVAEVPDYLHPAPGDTIVYFWDRGLFDDDWAGEWVLTQEDIGRPLRFSYSGDLIRERGDGVRYAQYEVHDRAGNRSAVASPKDLQVAAQPAPRVLPAIEIPLVDGSGQASELPLMQLQSDLGLVIPQAAVIRPGEQFELVWADEDAFGHWLEPGQEGKRDYSLPLAKIVSMAGKVVPLYYQVYVEGAAQVSVRREIRVVAVPQNNMPSSQLNSKNGGTLVVSELTADLLVTLGTWRHIGLEQRVSIWVEGVGPTPRHSVLDSYKLTATDVQRGIGSSGSVKLPLSYVRQLSIGSQMVVSAMLSYDDGETWPRSPNFPRTTFTLA
ncbi:MULTISPECIES: hypothetical protein [unclassified Pseudomonas]|uniref:hypothetical protein n=1 Tax=unclassified Pseudomonas TaxID=196821 RepID=UPI0035C07AC6